jgi:hypothetical protein
VLATEAQVVNKADLTGPNFTGTPKINGFPIAGVFSSFTGDAVDYPVGVYIVAKRIIYGGDPVSAINAQVYTFYDKGRYVVTLAPSLAGVILTGIWQSCGTIPIDSSNEYIVCRRTE